MAPATRRIAAALPRLLTAGALILAAGVALPAPAEAAPWWKDHDGCLVTEHRGGGGKKLIVDAGVTYAYVGGKWNDRISGVVCEVFCRLTVWEHRDYKGASHVFTENDRWVGNAWNDRISSMEASCDP